MGCDTDNITVHFSVVVVCGLLSPLAFLQGWGRFKMHAIYNLLQSGVLTGCDVGAWVRGCVSG